MGALRDEHGMTATAIAKRLGLSDATVGYYLSLLELDANSREKVRGGELQVTDAVEAVRRIRKRRRKKSGAAQVGAVWEPDYFTVSHPLARKAHLLCQAREHTMRRRIGKVACGQCWETVIREDERIAGQTLRLA